jgi:hypothetical protein
MGVMLIRAHGAMVSVGVTRYRLQSTKGQTPRGRDLNGRLGDSVVLMMYGVLDSAQIPVYSGLDARSAAGSAFFYPVLDQ